jgi:Zn-dependent M16 (insulinase) family peptidase
MVTDEVYNLRVQALFTDNMYGVDSGGDPTVIPNLTFQQFQVCILFLCGWTSK